MRTLLAPLLPILALTACASIPKGVVAHDQSDRPSEMVEGSPLYSIVARGAIAPIDDPTWLSHAEAAPFMTDDEPVIVVADAAVGGDGSDVRIYSTWYLEGHEIVNDHIGETAIAVTW
jgi:hypothetical protein